MRIGRQEKKKRYYAASDHFGAAAPMADAWYFQAGNRWMAVVRADQPEHEWFADCEADGTELPEPRTRPVEQVPTWGTLVYRDGPYAEAIEIEQGETEFIVVWEINVSGCNPREAAERALEIQRNPESWATVFHVSSAYATMQIDLSTDDADTD